MSWYTKEKDSWTEQSPSLDTPPSDGGLSIQVQADDKAVRPRIRVLKAGDERLHLTGVDPRPSTDTTHTAAWIPSDSPGALLFAVHTQGNDLIFEDLRASDAAHVPDSAVDQVQSSLNEIMIPVYIDDVISDLSESVSGLVVLHTAQYESATTDAWTYFRTSVFENGELALEAERGSM